MHNHVRESIEKKMEENRKEALRKLRETGRPSLASGNLTQGEQLQVSGLEGYMAYLLLVGVIDHDRYMKKVRMLRERRKRNQARERMKKEKGSK